MSDVADVVLQRLAADDALRQSVTRATTPEEVVALLAAAGITAMPEDISIDPATGRELSDAELSEVSGANWYGSADCFPPPGSRYFVFTQCLP